MSYDTKSIRQFLLRRFNDSELTQLCFDYFLDVYHDFSDGWSKSDKIQALLEHCLAHGRFPDLMAALGRERPSAFQAHFPEPVMSPAMAESSSTPAARNPRQVFISHAHQDAAFARRLADDLKAHGVPVWIAPDSLQPGEKWVEATNRGLEESGVFVLVLTKTAVASPWVKDETNVAIELSKEEKLRFIPLEVEAGDVPPLWRVFQRIPFQTDYEAGWKRLLAELGIEVAERGTAVPPIAEEHKTSPGWLERLQTVPVRVWGLVTILLLLGVFAIWQISGETNPESNKQDSIAVASLNVWSGFVEGADFQGEIVADVILRLDRQAGGLLFVSDENGRQLPGTYVDTANDAGEYRLSNFQLEAGFSIIVRDTSNLGDSYTLTVE